MRGVSLIDERTGGFQSLVLSDQGNFYLAHSGDVKIYENLGAFPRAFVAHRMRVAVDDEQALALMRDPAFDSADQVVLGSLPNPGSRASGEVEPVYGATIDRVAITHYTPERVEIEVDAGAPGHLVLTDAWYPGWGATVDGKRVPVLQADLLFRAVGVDAGHHLVIFTFRPESLFIGAGISLVGFICLAAVVGLIWGR